MNTRKCVRYTLGFRLYKLYLVIRGPDCTLGEKLKDRIEEEPTNVQLYFRALGSTLICDAITATQ